MVCPVENPICSTNIASKDYIALFDKFKKSVESLSNLKNISNTLITSNFTNYTSLKIINDTKTPDYKQIKVIESTYTMNGTFKIHLRSPDLLTCYWQINMKELETTIMFGNKPYCFYYLWCGKVIIGPNQGLIQNYANFYQFSKGVVHNVWFTNLYVLKTK